jgi:hypothetical protein
MRAIQASVWLLYVSWGRTRTAQPSMNTNWHIACRRPVGLMDKASAPGAGDSRFESWAGHINVHVALK